MKIKLQTNTTLFRNIVLITCFMILIPYNQSRGAGLPASAHNGNKVVVNFKHDTKKNELTIRVVSRTGAIMHLYIFTPDGILLEEAFVSPYKVTTIKGLMKGFYLYECFDKDERIKRGSLTIK